LSDSAIYTAPHPQHRQGRISACEVLSTRHWRFGANREIENESLGSDHLSKQDSMATSFSFTQTLILSCSRTLKRH